MLLYGADREVSNWVSVQLFGVSDQFNLSKAIGITKDNSLICGVVYSEYRETPQGEPLSIEMSIASIDKRWCSRHNLKALFSYPFTGLKVRRVQTLCSANEGKTIMFNQRLGFIQEGVHREAWPAGGDAISWSILKHECGWL